MNTKFEYLYRDASNYKSYHCVVLEGILSADEKQEIHDCCNGDNFIAEQLGLPHDFPSLNWGGKLDEEDDNCWCELFEGPNFGLSETDEAPTHSFSAMELLTKFRDAKGQWDEVTYDPFQLYG